MKTEIPFKRPSLPVIETLQLLRGLAAFLIALRHSFHEVFTIGEWQNFKVPDYPFVIGVDVFFVLSGFVMVYTSQGKFGQPGYIAEFIKKRIIRIVPVYWFYTFLLAAVALLVPQVLGTAEFEIPHFLMSLFFIPHINPGDGGWQPILANGWTLNYEMYFYLVFAILLYFRPKVLMVLLTVYFLGSVEFGKAYNGDEVWLKFYTSRIILDFLLGAWIAYLFIKGVRLPAFTQYPAILCVGLLFAAPMIMDVLDIKTPKHFRMISSALIVACLTLPKGSEDIKVIGSLKAVGDSSYTLYLFHPFVLGAVTQIFILMNWQEFTSPWIILSLCLLLSVISSIFLYFLIEKPLLKLGKIFILSQNQKKTKNTS